MIEAVIRAGLGLVAAAGLFLTFINRILTHLRRPSQKIAALFGLMIGLSVLFVGFGLFGGRIGMGIILATLGLLALGDLHYRLNSRRLRGSPPVRRTGLNSSLLRPNTTVDLNVYHYRVRLETGTASIQSSDEPAENRPREQGAERGLRIAHLSDLHLNHRLPPSYYCDMANLVRQSEPDLIFITGDFITETEGIHRFPELAEQLVGRYGTYAIFGNHDYWAEHKTVERVVSGTGVCLLGNGWQRVNADGKKLVLLGCELPWNLKPLIVPELQDDETLLALSHTADYFYRLNAMGAAAIFSGHYHAGQFQIPGFGPVLIPSNFGRRFYHGHYHINGTHLFVTAGVGASHPALRLYCPPDIMIVDFD